MRVFCFSGLFSCFIVLFLGSCKAPCITESERLVLPDVYVAGGDSANMASISWQRFFPDSILQSYIRVALDNNYSFREGLERINLAQSSLKMAKGALFPDVRVGVGAASQRFGDFTMDGVGNSETNRTEGLDGDRRIPNPYADFMLGASFSWEIDLWGKLNNKRRAALSRWLASREAARFMQTQLITQIASCYFELVGLDGRERVLKQTIEQSKYARDLALELKEAGNENQLAVDQFETLILSLKGDLLRNEVEIKARETALCQLMGRLPMRIDRLSVEELQDVCFPTEVGIPSQLLRFRPDIREAEQLLLASKADVAAAKAAFFPTLSLGGGGGFNAFDVSKWFLAPASLVYDLGAGLTAPLFQQHQIRALWNSAKSEQRIALCRYHDCIIRAYGEVFNTLWECESTSKRLGFKDEEVKIHIRSVESSKELFKLSFASYLEVLTAQEKLLEGNLEYLDLRTAYWISHVRLYCALGGGWIEE